MHTESIEPTNGRSEILQDKECRTNYQPGAVIYREGQECAGMFHLRTGAIKLWISSSAGKTAILKIARPGELLGVTEALVNCPYLATAEVIEQSETLFTARSHLQNIWSYRELTVQIVAQLSRESSRMFKEVSAYRLSSSASQRLAHLLLELLGDGTNPRYRIVEMPYTHAEIGQLIGCSRETVTRLLKCFQERNLIKIEHSRIHIVLVQELREIAQL